MRVNQAGVIECDSLRNQLAFALQAAFKLRYEMWRLFRCTEILEVDKRNNGHGFANCVRKRFDDGKLLKGIRKVYTHVFKYASGLYRQILVRVAACY